MLYLIFLGAFSHYGESRCWRFVRYILVIFVGILQAEYLWMFLSLEYQYLRYSYKEGIQHTTIFSRLVQIVIQITFITIMSINEVNSGVKYATIILCGIQIPFNAIYCLIMADR